MNDHFLEQLRHDVDNLGAGVHAMTDLLARTFATGEIASLVFDGKAGITEVTDDQGSDAVAYALYNDTAVAIEIGLVGGWLTVPKHKLLVAPVTINGHVRLRANAEALGETRISVLRWRFPTPQPFFVGNLE